MKGSTSLAVDALVSGMCARLFVCKLGQVLTSFVLTELVTNALNHQSHSVPIEQFGSRIMKNISVVLFCLLDSCSTEDDVLVLAC